MKKDMEDKTLPNVLGKLEKLLERNKTNQDIKIAWEVYKSCDVRYTKWDNPIEHDVNYN